VKRRPRILVVDDVPSNIRVLDAILAARGYEVLAASSGPEALARVAEDRPELVLLDILMPGMDGYEVCERIRRSSEANTAMLPVVMITASGEQEKVSAIEAGADDFITKPINQAELLARVRSLLRVKEFHDTIQAQTAELAELNRTLEERVQQQVAELERLGRLRRFLSPQLAELILNAGDESMLQSHRQEITVVFCDLRGFTAFAEVAEPEEVMRVLAEYHRAMGELIFAYEGTLERFAGDGLMVFFNDPLPVPEPEAHAVRMAVMMRERIDELAVGWRRRGYQLGVGIGIASGYATLGRIGFEGRFDYAAIGTVTNRASRLCDEAQPGEILIGPIVHAAVEELIEAEQMPELTPKGFARPIIPYRVLRLRRS
jgi:class 3 adenylate cyclase